MLLPDTFKIDFSAEQKDLISAALTRMLGQHYNKCALRQFVAAFVAECQELYDACLDMQRLRSPYEAEGENLNALGRIVGEDRQVWNYDETSWMFADRQGQGADSVNVWCVNAPIGVSAAIDDTQYRFNVILKAIKNHTLTSSVSELLALIKLAFGLDMSFEKTGPNQIRIIVPASISTTQLILLTQSADDERADNQWFINYPATLDISQVLMFAPQNFLMADVENRGCDEAPVAAGLTQIGMTPITN